MAALSSDTNPSLPNDEPHRHICLFGLSANPPTGRAGHQGIVSWLVKLEKFDEVWVLPVYNHMFSSKRQLAPFDDRLEMCRRSFEHLEAGPRSRPCAVRVLDTEKAVCLKRVAQFGEGTRTGTADILDELKQQLPGAAFSLCLGEDTYRGLAGGTWRRAGDIAEYVQNRFHVMRRTDKTKAAATATATTSASPSPSPSPSAATSASASTGSCSRSGGALEGPVSSSSSSSSSTLEEFVAVQNGEADRLRAKGLPARAFGATIHEVPGADAHEVSSSSVRRRILEQGGGEAGLDDLWLDPAVLSYVQERGLYVVGGGDGHGDGGGEGHGEGTAMGTASAAAKRAV